MLPPEILGRVGTTVCGIPMLLLSEEDQRAIVSSAYAVMTAGSVVLGRLTARFGHKPLLAVGAVLYGVYPLLISLAHDRWLFYAASLGGGLVWAVTNGGLVNRLMERAPETDRPAHMALHNLALNFGILGGSLLGPALGEGLGLRQALLLAAVLRMLAGVGLGVWG